VEARPRETETYISFGGKHAVVIIPGAQNQEANEMKGGVGCSNHLGFDNNGGGRLGGLGILKETQRVWIILFGGRWRRFCLAFI
jgi:hypothetical protein